MKKIYTLPLSAILFLELLCGSLFAQCPGPLPSVATPLRNGNTCRVIVQFTIPNVPVALLNSVGQLIGQGTSDANGNACANYPCDQNPTAVVGCGDNGCCFANIAEAASLPVKLTSFTARLQGSDVQLQWTTAFEIDNYKYVLERSYDGRYFSPVTEVTGSVYSFRELSYDFIDRSSLSNQSAYYRLKQIDIDGGIEYSKVVYVNNKKSGGKITGIFPNPFHSDIQLVGINSGDLNSKNIRIFSTTGQQVNFTVSGANELKVDATLPSGIYIVKINDQVFKLVKN